MEKRLTAGGIVRAILIGGVVWVLTQVGDALKTFMTGENIALWVRTLAVVGGFLIAGVIALISARSEPAPQTPSPDLAPAPAPRRRSFSLVLALLLILGVCGIGGWAGTVVVGKALAAVGQFGSDFPDPRKEEKLKDEPGTPRLVKPVTAKIGSLTVTVSKVDVNTKITRMQITVRSTAKDVVRLQAPQLTVPGANSIAEDPFRSQLGDIPPGGEMTGTIEFAAPVPAGVSSVTFTFGTWSFDFNVPRNGSVKLALKP